MFFYEFGFYGDLHFPFSPEVRGGGHIGFSADPIGVGVRVGVGVGVSVPFLLPTISYLPLGGISPNLHGYII